MDAQQFLAEFGHIANAPGGVQQLQNLILQLAIQGKLVDPGEVSETSKTLLAYVKKNKNKLVVDKKLPREKPFPKISDSELPIERPPHWEWTRFGEVWQLLSGRDLAINKYNDSKKGIPYITGASNIENGVINVNRWTDQPLVIAVTNDLLITCKGTIGKTVFNNLGEIHIARQIMAIRNFSNKLDTGFLKIWLDGFVGKLIEKSKSMIPGFSREDLIYAIYPIPPIEEQSRIVAKVDVLMALCDKLDAQQQSQKKLKKLLRATTLDAFITATNFADLKQSWLRLRNGLDYWGNDEQTPFELRNAIGAIACRGLLTDAGILQPETKDDLLPPLPEGWLWQTLGNLSTYITSGSRGWKQYLSTTGDIFIRSQDIKYDAVVLEAPAYVLLPEKAEGKRTLVQPGDLLLTITGGNVGKCAQVPDLPKPAYVSQHVALIRVKDPESTPFIHLWMTNIYGGRKFLGRYIYGDKPGLNLTQVASVPVPMPPKEIQAQIVGSLEQYASICNRLLQQVMEAQKTAKLLATAAVASITGIRTEEEEELKVPKTELISKLRLGENPGIKEQAPLAAILAGQNGEMASKDLWQRYGGEIDTFYAQLKLEVSKGWILEPAIAEMRQVEAI